MERDGARQSYEVPYMFFVCEVGEHQMRQHRFGGSWTAKKLDALKAYLTGYAQALKRQPFRRIYIDAFAGTGDRAAKRHETANLLDVPELDEITKGSVRLALEIDPPFDRYIFIEK